MTGVQTCALPICDESWNQKWRTPLRLAFDNLGKEIDTCLQREVKRIFSDKLEAQHLVEMFGPVISDLIPMEDFLNDINKKYPFDQQERTNIAQQQRGNILVYITLINQLKI